MSHKGKATVDDTSKDDMSAYINSVLNELLEIARDRVPYLPHRIGIDFTCLAKKDLQTLCVLFSMLSDHLFLTMWMKNRAMAKITAVRGILHNIIGLGVATTAGFLAGADADDADDITVRQDSRQGSSEQTDG